MNIAAMTLMAAMAGVAAESRPHQQKLTVYLLDNAGVPPTDPRLRRAIEWLCHHQNTDGGWGEDLRSYRDPAWIGRGDSTASQTAWALLALLAAAEPNAENSSSLERGLAFLTSTQRPDGTWDEPLFTGTGFPGDFYINYHLYRQVFPLMALGRAWQQRSTDA